MLHNIKSIQNLPPTISTHAKAHTQTYRWMESVNRTEPSWHRGCQGDIPAQVSTRSLQWEKEVLMEGGDRCLYHQHTAVSINQELLRPRAATSEVAGLFLEQHQRGTLLRTGLRCMDCSIWHVMPHYAKPPCHHFITPTVRGNMIMLRTETLSEAGGSKFYVSPSFVIVWAFC